MNLEDATLMFLTESAAYPVVASIAQTAYDRLVADGEIDYRVLGDLIGEASGKGVLRDLRRRHGPAAFDAIITPVLREIGRQKPIRSRRPAVAPDDDPLTAATWPR